jgi:hypothetical protein
MTRISWRLARHRSGSGTWPESLETADIPAEWQDPFTGKPFAYRLDEQPKLETEGRASDKTHLPYRPLKWALPE